jgi:Leucine-rich repeat (LRR) protein
MNPTQTPSDTPSSMPTIAPLLPNLPDYTLDALDDPNSPQNRSLEWLENHPNIDTLYYSTNDVNGTWSGWSNYSIHECDWFRNENPQDFFSEAGTCNQDMQYKYLSVVYGGAQGALPPELVQLTTELVFMVLIDNQLTGTIPIELTTLSKLQSLGISRNQIRGPVPTELGYLQNLNFLFLADNQLTGTIPTELGRLQALSSLALQITNSMT